MSDYNAVRTGSTTKPAKKVRQACDACHARKVRCDGRQPCLNCTQGCLSCTYVAVHRKTGPKGPRRRRPMAYPARPVYPIPDATLFGSGSASQSPKGASPTQDDITSPSTSSSTPDRFHPSPYLPDNMIQWCLEGYFKHKHPITPILHQRQIDQYCETTHKPPDSYALFASCCSVISLSPGILPPQEATGSTSQLTLPSTDFLLQETLRARRFCNIAEEPSLTQVQTSFFLFSTYFCLGMDNSAWFHLREAITMLQTLRLHEEITYTTLSNPLSATYSRRMFWVLFITERAYALQRHRPLTLRNTLGLPIIEVHISDAEILPGFLDLISLFKHFDIDFIETWNSDASTASVTATGPFLQLQDYLKKALPSVLSYSEMQQADLLISRQWLKVMVWQLCVSRTVLSSTGTDDSMSLQYPVTIARDAVLVSQLLPTRALEANGVGILEKIFDIGCSLADLLSLEAGRPSLTTMEVGPVDTLMEIVRILCTTLGGSYKHTNLLVQKVSECVPWSVDRRLQEVTEDLPYEEDVTELPLYAACDYV
ncbi:fungal specific transcription factor domain-containing protein [Sarocladium implicatum]|nr:fungal specific transcription factor domain-containing protein [Sarocladium implicatum]